MILKQSLVEDVVKETFVIQPTLIFEWGTLELKIIFFTLVVRI